MIDPETQAILYTFQNVPDPTQTRGVRGDLHAYGPASAAQCKDAGDKLVVQASQTSSAVLRYLVIPLEELPS